MPLQTGLDIEVVKQVQWGESESKHKTKQEVMSD